MQEYPKMLYGPRGWGDLDDCRLVLDAAEEKAAKKKGYADLATLPAPDPEETGAA